MDGQSRVGWLTHLLPAVLATSILFGLVHALNSMSLSYFIYYTRTISIVLIDPTVDPLMLPASIGVLSVLLIAFTTDSRGHTALVVPILSLTVSIGAVASFLTGSSLAVTLFEHALVITLIGNLAILSRQNPTVLGRPVKNSLAMAIVYLLVYLITIEAASATHYAIKAYDRTTLIGRADTEIEQQFTYAAYGLTPVLYIAFLFSWAWVPISQKLISRIQGKSTTDPSTILGANGQRPGRAIEILQDPRFYLVLAVAAFVGFYPYFQNPPWLVGTDAYWRYLAPLNRMSAVGGLAGFHAALREWHPTSSMILYAFQLGLGVTATEVVKHAPIVLVVLLGLSTWWFLSHHSNPDFGLLVFLISALSLTTAVGMFASIISNWMALVAWVAFFGYATAAENRGFKPHDAAILLATSFFILVMHPWTWVVFAVSVLAGAFIFWYSSRELFVPGILVTVVILDLILGLLILTFAGGGQLAGSEHTLQMTTYSLQHPEKILVFWDAVVWLTRVWSNFFNPLLMVVGIAGVFALSGLRSGLRRSLIVGWIFAAGIGSILVSPIGYSADPAANMSELWRMLYLTPFFLTLPFGIVKIGRLAKGQKSEEQRSPNRRFVWLMSVLGLGVLLAFLPGVARLIVLPLLISTITAFMLRYGIEEKGALMSAAFVLLLILVSFNFACRGLSQLLFDPHNAPAD